jgi:hypothetical protein
MATSLALAISQTADALSWPRTKKARSAIRPTASSARRRLAGVHASAARSSMSLLAPPPLVIAISIDDLHSTRLCDRS